MGQNGSESVENGGTAGEARPLFERRWLFLGVVFVLFAFHVWHTGYTSFRSDHLTQIPLIYRQEDPTLFPQDWFMQEHAHSRVRFYHTQLICSAWTALGPGLGIFALYTVFSCVAMSAWLAISRKVFGSIGPGILAVLMAIYWRHWELGCNATLENILIPRWEAQALAYWALYFVLSRRPAIAGLILGFAFYFHPSIALFFALPLAVWMLLGKDRARRRGAAWLFGVFVVVMLPHVLFLKAQYLGGESISEALAEAAVSPERAIRLCAWVRHPHHMVPRLWGWGWGVFALFAIVTGIVWRRSGEGRELGRIAAIVLGFMAVSVPFIEIWPARTIVFLQPFRMMQVFYLCSYLLLGGYAWRLIRDGGPLCVLRGFALVVAGGTPVLIVPVFAVEFYCLVRNRSRKTGTDAIAGIGLLAALTVAGLWDADYRRVAVSAILAAAIWGIARARRLDARPRTVAWILGAGCAIAVGFFGSFYALPYDKWLESPRENREAWGRALHYQLNPKPQRALERMGVWAEANTPRDALFMIPPEVGYQGFRLWSKRSVFFSAKFFPYDLNGMAEWQKRYLLCWGIDPGDASGSGAKMEAALRGAAATEGLENAYTQLSAAQILRIVDAYGIDFVITSQRYEHPRLRHRHTEISDPHRRPKRRAAPLNLYEVLPPS